MGNSLKKEFEYYVDNQKEFVSKYNGKVVVIKDQTIIGVYDTEMEAIEEISKIHEIGSFLVQKCEPGEKSYTQTFHSRAVFA